MFVFIKFIINLYIAIKNLQIVKAGNKRSK